MQVAAAHARGLHFDHDLAGLRGRVRKFHQLDFAPAREDYAAHGFLRFLNQYRGVSLRPFGAARYYPSAEKFPTNRWKRARKLRVRGFCGFSRSCAGGPLSTMTPSLIKA